MSRYEKRVDVHKIISRYPTGEIKETRSIGLQWVDEDAVEPEGYVFASVSTSAPEGHEMNIRRKRFP